MIHSKRLAILGLFLLAAGPAVLADEVVHFSNGTFLKVQSYKVEGDMIRVTLGPDASMAFPKNLVESIERSGHTVYPQVSSGPANVVVSGGAGGRVPSVGQYVQTGEGQVPARFRKGAAPEPEAEAAPELAGEKAGVVRPNPGDIQMPGRHGVLRAVGRRQHPVGEALIDATTPPGTFTKPRSFTSLAPRGAPKPPPSETTPPEPPPETPDDGAAEGDGTPSPD